MPYANFDDVQSLRSVYNNYLREDNDSNIFEFIGEKILSAGLIHDENEQENKSAKQEHRHPVNPGITVQIQTGVLYQFSVRDNDFPAFPVIKVSPPLINSILLFSGFCSGIFRPPVSCT